jgi:transposase
MPIKYSSEFKQDAVALVEAGSSQKQVCHDLGVSKSALQRWVEDARIAGRGLEPPQDVDERRRTAGLLRRIEELELENEILRKASAYLSQANLRRPK